MATIPRQCNHCKQLVRHYGACVCPDAQLELIDAERVLLQKKLEYLDIREREVLGLRTDG
jgi:hypothetical protein